MGVFRFGIFVAERVGSGTVPPDIYPICTWMLRIVLMFTAGVVFLYVASVCCLLAEASRTLIGSDSHGMRGAILSAGVYALTVLVMNAPYFPLQWSIRAYGWVHLVLLPCLVPIFLNFREFAAAILILLALYSFLWRLCLADRQKIPVRV